MEEGELKDLLQDVDLQPQELPLVMYVYEAQRMGWLTETVNLSPTRIAYSELDDVLDLVGALWESDEGEGRLKQLVASPFKEKSAVQLPEESFLTAMIRNLIGKSEHPKEAFDYELAKVISEMARQFTVDPQAVAATVAVAIEVRASRQRGWLRRTTAGQIQLAMA